MVLIRTAFRARPSPFFLRTRPLLLAFGFSIPLLQPRPITRFDTSPDFSSSAYSHSRDAKTPLTRDGNRLNPAAVKQISLGSILGLGCGILLSAFSTSLTLMLGLGIVAWTFAARKGYSLVPVNRLQRYFRNIDLRSAINDNVAFKLSFGLMFALTAFGEL